jgi:hypothetical protein
MDNNKYLTKVCALLRAPEPPRSERYAKKHKIVHPPKLNKFTAKIKNNLKHHKD